MLMSLIDSLSAEFKKDPRNKVFVSEQILLASAAEETGKKVTPSQLRKVIASYISGDMDEKMEAIYDGAIYSCGLAARHCFSDDPEDDIDYEISWIEDSDGSYTAEVSPN